jgi:multiple sugar transport system substrate-binding protein
MGRRVAVLGVLIAVAIGLTACGGKEESAGSGQTLNFFIFNEPGGGPQKVAEQCSKDSGGKYTIDFTLLPNTADQQREQLVRRLGAEDAVDRPHRHGRGVDRRVRERGLARAGPRGPPAGAHRERVRERAGHREVRGQAVQRPDLVEHPAALVPQGQGRQGARDLGRDDRRGGRAEDDDPGPGQPLRGPGRLGQRDDPVGRHPDPEGAEEIDLAEGPTKRALSVMGKLANSPAADPAIDTSEEDPARMAFEAETSNFMINYPFVYPSAEENAPEVFKNIAAAKYPKVDADKESRPPLGGINIGVSSFSKNKDLAFEAIECMVKPENQTTIAEMGGLPPVREDIYDSPEIEKIYPGFANLIRESIADAGPRPSESPAYQDLSLGIQRGVHPVTAIKPDNPDETYKTLRDFVEQAIKREGLL